MKKIAIIGVLAVGIGLASAQTTNTFTVSPNAAIPVGSIVGLASTTDVTGFTGETIANITVNLNISGGYNGDLYAYLAGPNGGFDVLLNQPGGTANSFGYLDAGLSNVTFDDSSANSIQTYQLVSNPGGAALTGGVWQSAGTSLNSFVGTDPDGTWTLFVANLASGTPVSTLNSWGFTIVTTPVPEPQTWMMAALGFLGLMTILKRKRAGQVSPASR